MKHIICIILLLLVNHNNCFSQSKTSSDPLKGIALNPYRPYSQESDSTIPEASMQKLLLKIKQIANVKSISSSISNPRFIITASVDVLSKDITATAPPMVAVELDINFFIGDGNRGKIFSFMTKSVKGVGSNERKAFNDAINNIKANDPNIQDFVNEGKQKIVSYFATKCDEVIREAELLAAANEYGAAVYQLMLVPEECSTCFNRCLKKVIEIVPEKSKYNCDRLLLKAKATWAASLTREGADSAAAILSQIGVDINTECSNEIKKFVAEMSKTMKERNNKEWEYKGRLVDEKEKTVDEMKAFYKEIAIEHSKKQNIEPVHYNINNWQKD